MKKYVRILVISVIAVLLLIMGSVVVEAAIDTAQDMAVFPGVTVSPDGTAWTTDYMDKTNERLPEGYTIYTGIDSELRELQEGEHYYDVPAQDNVKIGKWVVEWSDAQCIHYFEAQEYKGFQTTEGICGRYYNNGWFAYCADCGERAANVYVYGKSDTIKGITAIPAASAYLYICPHCHSLEQGVAYHHICKDISYNFYKVYYNVNAPSDSDRVTGFMAHTQHMYNNAAMYEGRPAAESGITDTKLRKNSFLCEGYVFVGWNTEADGSGTSYTDGQEVLNLTDAEGGAVTLYAQWKKCENTLVLDANGGTYHGRAVFEQKQSYGTTYEVDMDALRVPAGYTISFVTNGGSKVNEITTTKSFSHWEMQSGFSGKFKDNIYYYAQADGTRDVLMARYVNDSFILPDCIKDNESLAGWYTEPDLNEDSFVGKPGESVVLDKDTVLYAKWAALTLWAYEDYESYNGVGAVDLRWEQKDGKSKFYKLYQSMDRTNWKGIYTGSNIADSVTISEYFGTDKQGESYTVNISGYYTLTAKGAGGADYSASLTGGKGGSVTATYWLEAGDVITCYAGNSGDGRNGGSNGSTGQGGTADAATGRGGGAATEIYLTRAGVRSALLIAGGGGGANEKAAGGQGGSSLSVIGSMAGAGSTYGGGGGGAKGGTGGVYVAHYHEGDPNSGGGCYVLKTGTKVCGESRADGGYWECSCGATWGDGSDHYYAPKHEDCDYTVYNESFCCSGCGTGLGNGETHYVSYTYTELGCKYADKPDGYVISAEAAQGGTNYIDTGFGCQNQSSSAGIHDGAGSATIQSTDIGYREETFLNDILARDMAAPNRVTEYRLTQSDIHVISVHVTDPADNGTTYYHKAESYSGADMTKLADSNITESILITGVKGYRYYVDTKAAGEVNASHAWTESRIIHVTMPEETGYLHIAAEDTAGNLGATTTIELGKDMQLPTDDTYPEKRQILTEQLRLEDTDFVYQADAKNYYVKADGFTEHTLLSGAYLDGAATQDYQIDTIRFYISDGEQEEWLQTTIPHGDISYSSTVFSNDSLQMSMSGDSLRCLSPGIAMAERNSHAIQVNLEQKFTVTDGPPAFEIYPQAQACLKDKVYYSVGEQDLMHGIVIIPDGTAPAIEGLDELANFDILDMTEQTRMFELSAGDDGSGLEEFTIYVNNRDNHMQEAFASDAAGKVLLTIEKDNPLFVGDIAISAIAVDRVGNANIIGEDGLTFTLETNLYRERNPAENVFKTGDGAVLTIQTSGYVERIEVIFPEELLAVMPELNHVYEYEYPYLRNTEKLHFNIPLGVPEKEYEVIVKAYKNGQMLVSKPTMVIVEGNVLDELRTRIRNNG